MNTSVSGIYQIKHIASGKIYIGSSINIQLRWNVHTYELNKNKHHSPYLQRAWNKYGADAFEFSIIETCFVFALIFREQHYINLYHPAYNVSPTAGNAMLGKKHTAEARKKISEAGTRRSRTPETLLKMIASGWGKSSRMLGRKHSPETIVKMKEAAKGRIITPEQKIKLSIAAKARKRTPLSAETRAKISSAHTARFLQKNKKDANDAS